MNNDTPSPERKRAKTSADDRLESSTVDPSTVKPTSAKLIDLVVSKTRTGGRTEVQKQVSSERSYVFTS
jgi:hypothetical protein